MSMAVDGLISGLDTTALINSLMTLEAGPQTLLKSKVTTANTLVTGLQALNSSIASLATLATESTVANALDLYTASSSSTGVTTTASSTASAGSIDIVVDRLAQTQVSVSDTVTEWAVSDFTITSASGTVTTIAADSTSLDDVVTAVNASEAGVSAVKVAAGADANGNALYRLQFTSAEPGADAGFTVDNATLTTIKTAQDAQVTLWSGTTAAQSISSSSNTFAELLPGVAVTVTAASDVPVTITVTSDDDAVSAIAEGLVSSLNAIFAQISTKTAVVNSTDSSGAAIVSAGIFSGDTTVRAAQQLLISAASMPVDGRSPSEIGISITKSGTLEFDAEKFAAAMAEDPDYVKSVLTEIATRVAGAAESASDKYDGLLTSKITGQESLVKSLGTQIDSWDLRLTSRRSSLERTYASLEVQLSNMNAQSAWLTAQVESLNASKSSS
ncbi:flagellar hook-associated protein [Cryobacterium melibiosiphilum]|uniref:Flagellar hook-associated protein 2 n=1 Tax=Cryobacterium melibiosiphilum TaxID=995039 RepID=A0A3A5MMR9_9MICO|nr:flagellar filament capping protein FliD [Cryobacterium melibiosiphilum]RJT88193.1 flagellar hook-associated protein [Cryobacterium melibiosiphilum]